MLLAVEIVRTFPNIQFDRIKCIIKYNDNGYWAYTDELTTKWYRPGCYFIDESRLNDETIAYEGFEE